MEVTKIIFVKGDLGEQVCLADSKIHGVGLFAKEDIPADFSIHQTHVYDEKYEWVNITPSCQYNHSKLNPNCVILTTPPFRVLISLRDISEGEELLVDYTLEPDIELPSDSWKNT